MSNAKVMSTGVGEQLIGQTIGRFFDEARAHAGSCEALVVRHQEAPELCRIKHKVDTCWPVP